jgi:hypothetical protein
MKKPQHFTFLLRKYLLIFEIIPVIRFKDPKAVKLALKMLTEAACDSVKSYRKPPVTLWHFISCTFSQQQKKLIIV